MEKTFKIGSLLFVRSRWLGKEKFVKERLQHQVVQVLPYPEGPDPEENVQEKVKKVDAGQEVLLLQVVVHRTTKVENAVQEENIADHLRLQVLVQVFLNPDKNAQRKVEKIRNRDPDPDPDLDPDHLMILNVG